MIREEGIADDNQPIVVEDLFIVGNQNNEVVNEKELYKII
jgi:hypothetical protein